MGLLYTGLLEMFYVVDANVIFVEKIKIIMLLT